MVVFHIDSVKEDGGSPLDSCIFVVLLFISELEVEVYMSYHAA